MSGLIVTIFMFGTLAVSTISPILAMYIYDYVTYMSPKSTLYGPGIFLPWAVISFLTAGIFWLIFDRKRISHFSFFFFLFIGWIIWINITSYFGQAGQRQIDFKYDPAIKTLLASILMFLLLNSRIRVEGLVIVLIASVGFFIGRGFVITLLHGGGGLSVTGEVKTTLGDRNVFALVVWTLVPLLMWLASYSTIFPRNKLFQLGLIGVALASIVTIVGTESRGAVVAAPVFFAFFFFQSQKKFAFLIFGVLAAIIVVAVAPQEWWTRIISLSEGGVDASGQSRLNTWTWAWHYALSHPIAGGGFRIFTKNVDPLIGQWLEAHSIYFEVMAEHGFVGLFLFLSLMGGLAYSGFKLKKRCKPYPELHWAGDLGVKLSVSILLYLSAGAFLAVSTHPITYDLAVLSMAVITIANREIAGYEATKQTTNLKLRFGNSGPENPVSAADMLPLSDERDDIEAKPNADARRKPDSYMERRKAAMALTKRNGGEAVDAEANSRQGVSNVRRRYRSE